MDAILWPELEKHFDHALTLPPGQRARYVADIATTRPELHHELQRLLKAADAPQSALDRPALDALRQERPSSLHPDRSGQRIGAYRLLDAIGSGGMGEVYRAERADGRYQQTVAVKLLRADAIEALPRFEAEQRILAQLEHPGIARLYDAGITDDGRPYIVMEWVAGTDIVRWCAEHTASLEQRLTLFAQVCDAVSWAHRHLLVHRDLKPANVLVTPEGQIKLLDFGIAKDLAGHDTQTVNAPLTPAYAAPEQLTGSPITTATDVYALGIMLFQLLTGRLPWPGTAVPLAAALERLLDAPAPAPSRIVPAGFAIGARALRGDLDAVVGKALRKEPAARYPDARTLADDVHRYLEHRPVQARAGARSYVLRRTLRRHWLALATTAAVFAALSASLVAITWQARKARLEAQRAESVQSFMTDLFRTNSSRQPDPVAARKTTARELLDIGAARVEGALDEAPENKRALLRLFGELYGDLALADEETRLRRQAVQLSTALYGDDSTERFDDLLSLATAMRDSTAMGDTAQVLDDARAILDRRHEAGTARRGLLWLKSAEFFETSDLARARTDAEQAVAILGALPPSPELAEALYEQGATASNMGEAAVAIVPLQRAIEISRTTAGDPNPELVVYGYQLAMSQAYALRYADAEASARKTLDIALAINGENHAYTLRARMMLGNVLLVEEKFQEAMAALTQAKATALRILAPDEAFHRPTALYQAARAEARAGAIEAALADVQAALAINRAQEPRGTVAASNLEEMAGVLLDMGRQKEALAALDDARSFRREAGDRPREANVRLRIRAALDAGRVAQARTLLGEYAIDGKDEEARQLSGIRHDLLDAEIMLAEGLAPAAAQRAADAGSRAAASAMAPYLHLTIADGALLEGRARLRSGDAQAALPLLSQALATRTELLLPDSPAIAEAQLAVADCELRLGRRRVAAEWVGRAAAIEAAHAMLSERYRAPLTQLQVALARH